MNKEVKYSIVVPLYNEAANVTQLYVRVTQVMEDLEEPYEIVLVDDGSKDDTPLALHAISASDSRVRIVTLRRNFGQTPALKAGFDAARGEIIISMDGDLQHDPEEIPAFIAKLEEGYDIVSGWRAQRRDGWLSRRLPSRIANWMMGKLSGVALHDFGTTFKAYRRETLKSIQLYGELHRFIPALASFYGARVVEVPIKNVPRPSGASHYGLGRTFRVFFDIITIKFMLKYMTRPMHFFGQLGVAGTGTGGLILLYLAVKKLIWGDELVMQHGPLMLAGALAFLAGLMMFSTGLLGEMLTRTYFESQGRRIYAVREIRTRRDAVSST